MKFQLSEYGFLRIGVSSPEMLAADAGFNTQKTIDAINQATQKNCFFLLFPELNLTGYTCGDLFFQKRLLDSAAESISTIAAHTSQTGSTVIVGAPVSNFGKLYNCGVVISNGEILGVVPKTYLCNSNEYYEERWFSSEFDRYEDFVVIDGKVVPFGADLLFSADNFDELRFGIEICEDMWAVKPPSLDMAIAGATLICNLSASNEYLGKKSYRLDLVKSQSARCLAALAYSSSGPGESSTDTVFSGHSIIAENGIMLSETERYKFETQIAFADIDLAKMESERRRNNSLGISNPGKILRLISFRQKEVQSDELFRKVSPSPFIPSDENMRKETCREIFDIQTTGLARRLLHANYKCVVIGVSGGLDSTLALLAAVSTFLKINLDRKGIIAVSMPGFGTTRRTRSNAAELCKKLGVSFRDIPIEKAVLQHFKDIGHNPKTHDIVFENAQARERTQILMDLANKESGLVIGTGDLSELALGWSTYGGDHISMYGMNSGIPKTLVKYIIEWCAGEKFEYDTALILRDIIDTPISPELLPAGDEQDSPQKTEESIGPYELHDFFLYYIIRWGFSPKKVLLLAGIAFENKCDSNELLKWLKVFYTNFFRNQFKRSCLPDGVKVGSVALSPRADWRMPSDASARIWLGELEKI